MEINISWMSGINHLMYELQCFMVIINLQRGTCWEKNIFGEFQNEVNVVMRTGQGQCGL